MVVAGSLFGSSLSDVESYIQLLAVVNVVSFPVDVRTKFIR